MLKSFFYFIIHQNSTSLDKKNCLIKVQHKSNNRKRSSRDVFWWELRGRGGACEGYLGQSWNQRMEQHISQWKVTEEVSSVMVQKQHLKSNGSRRVSKANPANLRQNKCSNAGWRSGCLLCLVKPLATHWEGGLLFSLCLAQSKNNQQLELATL